MRLLKISIKNTIYFRAKLRKRKKTKKKKSIKL